MRNIIISLKLAAGISVLTYGLVLSSSAAYGVTTGSESSNVSSIDVAGSMARASTDIRVRRLKQMFNNNQISADEYFVRASQSEDTQSPNTTPSTAE